jgi:hypothetical protein
MMLVHGSNLEQKETHPTKYRDKISRRYLAEIRPKYNEWHKANVDLVGPTSTPTKSDEEIVAQRVKLFEDYKNFLDRQKYAEQFDSRSNLHSSVLEEFLYYLFRDLVSDFGKETLIGKSHAFKDIFFIAPNYRAMLERPNASIERKDHDFVIGVTISAELTTTKSESHIFEIPAVAIECKTYLDKTMLEGSSRAAEELKAKNPNGMYLVVMEWLKLTGAVNLRKYKVDQIYVFRKQRNTDREFRFDLDYEKNPIDPAVVYHLFELVRSHLTTDWEGGLKYGLERGWLL